MLYLNVVLTLILFLAYGYQIALLVLSLKKAEPPPASEGMRIAVLIPAKDEEEIIASTVENTLKSDYPKELFDVFVLDDNSTDDTANSAREAGALVYTRRSDNVGKGYALEYLLERVFDYRQYDAYAIIDADNRISPEFLSYISASLCEGYDVAVGCRIPDNFGESAVTSLSGMCFLFEAVFLNRGRMAIGGMPFVLGTGFAFTHEYALRMGGWRFFSLTEDFEMCAYMSSSGARVRYTDEAVFFDPQPLSIRDSRSQRLRWTRGGGEVLRAYFGRLVRALAHRPSFAVFDVLFSYAPAFIFALAFSISSMVGGLLSLFGIIPFWRFLLSTLIPISSVYSVLFLFGIFMLFAERRILKVGFLKKIIYSLLFPCFIFSFFPIGIVALLKKRVKWRKINRLHRK